EAAAEKERVRCWTGSDRTKHAEPSTMIGCSLLFPL
ncbi:MAG: hypothetical protein ACI9OU_001086, partial [Candidatus Promineifilaceae bacterium]